MLLPAPRADLGEGRDSPVGGEFAPPKPARVPQRSDPTDRRRRFRPRN